MKMLRSFIFIFFVLGSGCSTLSSAAAQRITLDLDDYGRSNRKELIDTMRPHSGETLFFRGRILITHLSYPDAPYINHGDGRIYPCMNNLSEDFIDKIPTHKKVSEGVKPHPWFFSSRFVDYSNGSFASAKMSIDYKSFSPMKSVTLSELHGKCVTLLAKLTGEMEITATTAAGTLYIYNIYDTEFILSD